MFVTLYLFKYFDTLIQWFSELLWIKILFICFEANGVKIGVPEKLQLQKLLTDIWIIKEVMGLSKEFKTFHLLYGLIIFLILLNYFYRLD